MKKVYPIILTPANPGYVVYIPDFDIGTQGDDLADALYMARDAIGMIGLDYLEKNKPFPDPKTLNPPHEPGETVTLVDVDFAAYKLAHDQRSVRVNVTLPGWMKDAAEKNGIRLSAALQKGLKEQLHISE